MSKEGGRWPDATATPYTSGRTRTLWELCVCGVASALARAHAGRRQIRRRANNGAIAAKHWGQTAGMAFFVFLPNNPGDPQPRGHVI